LPSTDLGNDIENRVNNFLKKKNAEAEVTIRVISSSEREVKVEPGMTAMLVLYLNPIHIKCCV